MASTKVPVDHSALSGTPPKPADVLNAPQETFKPGTAKDIMNGPSRDGGFLASVTQTLQKNGVDVATETTTPAPATATTKSVLANIRKGLQLEPPRILLVGTEGIGKSSWAAAAPAPIFVQTEDGLGSINCEKFPLAKSYQDVREALTGLATEPHHYQTVVIDSVDWLEKLIFANVCLRTGKKNIEDIGYAKGYTFALDEWAEVVGLLMRCRARNMAIILIAHAKIERFEDPENPSYDRYSPRLHKHAQAYLTEWVDATLFATQKMTTKREDETDKGSRPLAVPVGAGGGERVIRTVGGPACVAKNRYGLPPEIPLSWAAFQDGLAAFFTKNKTA